MNNGHFIRPSQVLLACIGIILIIDCALAAHALRQGERLEHQRAKLRSATALLGLTDLCVATEARYTRHPSVSDWLAPFMDHPWAIEHFPTGSFWYPPPSSAGRSRW